MTSNISEDVIDSILDIVDKNEELIIYDYKDKKDQILFSKELVDKFYHVIDDIIKDIKDAKTVLKYAIREVLELNSSDIVISKNGHYFIKLFDDTRKKDVAEERRYDGINEEDLKSFYDEFFSEKENVKIFPEIAKEFVNTLNEKKITNDQYEQTVFKDIQSIICKYFILKYDNGDEFFNGFSGYFFRIHFEKVFEFIADLILYEITNANLYMTEFIKYYSVNILVIDGKKYKIPSMETNDGLKWNVTSILSIAKKHFQSQEYKKNILQEINNLQLETSKLHIGGISPLKHQTNITKEIQELNLNLKMQTRDLYIHSDALDLAKTDNEKKELKAKVSGIKDVIKDLGNQKKDTSSRVVEDSVLKKYNTYRKDLDAKMRELKSKETIINQNNNLYSSMRVSLVKALISKKKLLVAK